MTEHTDEPTTEPAQAPAAAPPEAPAAPQPPQAPPLDAVHPGQPYSAQPQPGQPYAAQPFSAQGYPAQAFPAPYRFQPVSKEPWFNPAKRTAILVSAVVLALVLLGGGFVLGAAASNRHDHRGPGFGSVGPRMGAPGFPNGGGRVHGPRGKQNNPGPAQLPSPSTSSTGS